MKNNLTTPVNNSIRNSVKEVFNFILGLSSCLPVALIGDLMQQLDLFISVKPKKGQLQSVIVKSIEQNIHCMYRARSHLLDCSYQPALGLPETTPPLGVSPPPASLLQLTSAPRTPSPAHQCPSPQNGHASVPPSLKESGSKVTFSREPTLISPDGETFVILRAGCLYGKGLSVW